MEIEPVKAIAGSGRLNDYLTALFEVLGLAAQEFTIGTLLLIDELQEASKEDLSTINMAVRRIGQAGVPLPVVMVGAGRPLLPAQLADAGSYAERLYAYQRVVLLSTEAVQMALNEPCRVHGGSWDDGALARPSSLRRGTRTSFKPSGSIFGISHQGPVIRLADVEGGGRLARDEIDAGLYRSRCE